MTECEEVAEEIFRSLPAKAIECYGDAEEIAEQYMRDQGQTVIDNVAEALWQISQRRR